MPDTIPNDDLPACLKFFCKSRNLKFLNIGEREGEGEMEREVTERHAWTWGNKKEIESWRKSSITNYIDREREEEEKSPSLDVS